MSLNQKIKELSQEDFMLLKKFVKRSNEIRGVVAKELIYFSYGFVKIDLPGLLEEGDFEKIIDKIVWVRDVKTLEPQEALPFIFWVYDSLKGIVKIEKEYLSGTPDVDLINAGIERLNELGETNLIDTLAGGDVTKWEEVKRLPYHVIFDKQRKMKLEADIQRDLAKIQKNKSKQKKLH